MNTIGWGRQATSCGLSILLVLTLVGFDTGAFAYQTQDASTKSSSSSYAGQGTPETTDELQSLVAPIALYPDALVAQILSAATFPDQVAVANYWVQQNKTLTGSALMMAVDKQGWDPSVKALTQFPSVLDNMAKNLSWTSQLGEAYHNSGTMDTYEGLKEGSKVTVKYTEKSGEKTAVAVKDASKATAKAVSQ